MLINCVCGHDESDHIILKNPDQLTDRAQAFGECNQCTCVGLIEKKTPTK